MRMNRANIKQAAAALLFLGALITGCRKDPKVTPEEANQVTDQDLASKKSFYLLNEGNMNMNKASLDFFDTSTGDYRRNIYEQANPGVVRGLGDVGNDIQIYGSKLYIVVNNSNKVEVLDARTAKKLGQIDIVNCRYITFFEGKAYVSSYQSRTTSDASANGYVARIDTSTFSIEQKVSVGRQPEQMAVSNGKLYVANSGGYDPGNYEKTLSVIDLRSFMEIKRIEVGLNPERVQADRYGDLYVTSRGDSYDVPSRLIVVSSETDQVKKTFEIAAINLSIDGDRAYVIGDQYSYITQQHTYSYALLNVKDETIVASSFISDGTDRSIEKPYGLAIDPSNKDIYLSDAKDFLTPGTLYCFDKNGHKKWSVTTGDIPAHFAFVN